MASLALQPQCSRLPNLIADLSARSARPASVNRRAFCCQMQEIFLPEVARHVLAVALVRVVKPTDALPDLQIINPTFRGASARPSASPCIFFPSCGILRAQPIDLAQWLRFSAPCCFWPGGFSHA